MQQAVSLLQILLLAQHVLGTIMPIIKSSRVLYRWLLPELWVVCLVCGMLQHPTTHSCTPDQQLENQSTKYHRQQPPV